VTSRKISDRALRQIDGIFDYIAQRDARAAQSVVDRIHAVIGLITERPLIGRKTLESGVRTYIVDPYPYLVFYRYSERRDEVQIIRVRDGAMKRAGLQDEPAEFRAQPAS
jgi:plasmid stabilization system protein ParE